MQKPNPKKFKHQKNPNPKPQTLQANNTKPSKHKPKMQKPNPKKIKTQKKSEPQTMGLHGGMHTFTIYNMFFFKNIFFL